MGNCIVNIYRNATYRSKTAKTYSFILTYISNINSSQAIGDVFFFNDAFWILILKFLLAKL